MYTLLLLKNSSWGWLPGSANTGSEKCFLSVSYVGIIVFNKIMIFTRDILNVLISIGTQSKVHLTFALTPRSHKSCLFAKAKR